MFVNSECRFFEFPRKNEDCESVASSENENLGADAASPDTFHANALGLALRMDMAQWFTPTADNFFSKVSKSRIVQALAEAGTPLMIDTAPLKKADLAARAEKAIQNTGWLPEPLRIIPTAKENNKARERDESQQEAA